MGRLDDARRAKEAEKSHEQARIQQQGQEQEYQKHIEPYYKLLNEFSPSRLVELLRNDKRISGIDLVVVSTMSTSLSVGVAGNPERVTLNAVYLHKRLNEWDQVVAEFRLEGVDTGADTRLMGAKTSWTRPWNPGRSSVLIEIRSTEGSERPPRRWYFWNGRADDSRFVDLLVAWLDGNHPRSDRGLPTSEVVGSDTARRRSEWRGIRKGISIAAGLFFVTWLASRYGHEVIAAIAGLAGSWLIISVVVASFSEIFRGDGKSSGSSDREETLTEIAKDIRDRLDR